MYHNMNQKELIRKIRNAMLDSEINQKSLAKKMGVKQEMISHWLTGYRNPSFPSLKKIAKATNKPLRYFLNDPASENIVVDGKDYVVNRNNVSKKIKMAMLDGDFNQVSLSKKMGYTQSMVSNWLTGHTTPSPRSLKKIAKATNKPLSYFLDDSENTSGNNNILNSSVGAIVGHKSNGNTVHVNHDLGNYKNLLIEKLEKLEKLERDSEKNLEMLKKDSEKNIEKLEKNMKKLEKNMENNLEMLKLKLELILEKLKK